MGDCKDCKHAVVTYEKKVECTCKPIRTFTYTGDDLICNEFFHKKVVDKKVKR